MAGVTILLSKHHSQNYDTQTKVIHVKPIKIKTKQETSTNNSSFEKTEVLQNEIHTYEKKLSKLKEHKEILLKEIKDKIKQEKENWKDEKKTLIKQAHEQGYHDGFELGKQESLQKHQILIDEANEIIKKATKDYHVKIEDSEEIIIELAIHTAQKVMKKGMKKNPESFLPIVRSAIKEIKDHSNISLYLHPKNYEFVRQQKKELVESLDGDTNLSIYIDQELNENDCLIEHPLGQIDASLDTQLLQIRKALQEYVMENKQ